jgi:methyltransferase (TIGR00027 family)
VILGAGFDCRALRLKELAGLPVFEVDRAPMVAFKNGLLAGAMRGRPIRVAVDFQQDVLEDRLREAGFAPGVKTLFLWEGVTNYLDAKSVGAVFDFAVRAAPSGSRFIFTYIHADAVDGSFPAPGLRKLLGRLRESGEPWTFGFRPEEVPGYLAAKGLRLKADLGAVDYRARYLPGRPEGYEFYRVALAETGSESDAAG